MSPFVGDPHFFADCDAQAFSQMIEERTGDREGAGCSMCGAAIKKTGMENRRESQEDLLEKGLHLIEKPIAVGIEGDSTFFGELGEQFLLLDR